MAVSRLWTEVWTRPGATNFGRVIDDPRVSQGGIHKGLNQVGNGNMKIPSSFTRFNEILRTDSAATAVSSLVRVFSERDPTTPIFEWLPNQLAPTESKNDPDVSITGLGMNAALAYARLEPYDWDGSDNFAPLVPDWNYGGTNILVNPGFENSPFPNGGFEDGNTGYWQTTISDGFLTAPVGLIAVKDAAEADSGDWFGLIDAPPQKAGAARSFTGLVSGATYTITGKLKDPTASGSRYRAGIGGAVSASHANAYEADGYWWAELGNAAMGSGASNGAWQSFTLTFVAGTSTITLVIIYDDPGTGPDTELDTWTMSGKGVGLYPWEPVNPELTNIFEYQTAIVDTGSAALMFQATDSLYISPYTGLSAYGFSAGAKQLMTLTPNVPHVARIRIRQDSGSNQTYLLIANRDTPVGGIGSPGSSYINSTTQVFTSGSFQTIELAFTPDVAEVWIEVRWLGSAGNLNSPVTYLDNGVLFEGLAETTIGDILTQIYEHAIDADLRADLICWDDGQSTDTPYLTLDFDAALDSGGNAWTEPEVSTRLTMRQSYSQIMANLAKDYAVEYRIVPNDVETGTWLWQVYNAGGMDAAPDIAIQGGSSDVRRSVNRFAPSGTDQMVEGLGRVTARARNTTLMANLGRIEASALVREASDLDGAATAVASANTFALTASQSLSYTLVDNQDEPETDFTIGDTVVVEDPPEVDASSHRYVDLVVSYAPTGVEWQTQYGSTAIMNPDAAVANAVSGLLAKFEYPDYDTIGAASAGGGTGGAFTIQVCAANSSQIAKDKADFECSGTNDHEVIVSQFLTLYQNAGGRVLLAEGTYNCDPDLLIVGYNATYPVPMILQGMGESTIIKFTGSATNWGILVANNCKVLDLKVEL